MNAPGRGYYVNSPGRSDYVNAPRCNMELFQPRARLWVTDLLRMCAHPSRPDAYTFMGRDVLSVEVLGVVHATGSSGAFRVYSVDDGTGVIPCVVSKHRPQQERARHLLRDVREHPDYGPDNAQVLDWLLRPVSRYYDNFDRIQLGDTVNVQGFLSEFRGKRQLRVSWMWLVEDYNEEVDRILEIVTSYRCLQGQCKQSSSAPSAHTSKCVPKKPRMGTPTTGGQQAGRSGIKSPPPEGDDGEEREDRVLKLGNASPPDGLPL